MVTLLFISICTNLLFSPFTSYTEFVNNFPSSSTFVSSLDFQSISTSSFPLISIYLFFSTFLLLMYCPPSSTVVFPANVVSFTVFSFLASTANFIVAVLPAFICFNLTTLSFISVTWGSNSSLFILKFPSAIFISPLKYPSFLTDTSTYRYCFLSIFSSIFCIFSPLSS